MKTIILTRHANYDIIPGVANDKLPLNAAGQAGAAELARVLGAAGVTAIFTSEYQRTKETAAPLAAALGLSVQSLPAASSAPFATAALSGPSGPVVLIVGHSDSVPELIAALGAPYTGPTVLPGFDNLFIVTVGTSNQASTVWLKYRA